MKRNINTYNPETYEIIDHDLAHDYESFLDKVSNLPNTFPQYNQVVSSAGIVNQKMMVYIKDFTDTTRTVPVLCDIKLGVELQDYRGIHMSRCMQTIFGLAERTFENLDVYAQTLADIVREKQESKIGIAEVTGTYIHKTVTKKSKQYSFDSLQLLSKAVVGKKGKKVQTGMQVYNVTACPCTKAFIKYMIAPELQKKGFTIKQINDILKITHPATHTQRGTTRLMLDKEDTDLSHKELYAILSRSVHLVNDLLKRADEHDLVLRALEKPQFTEDVAREVSMKAYEDLHHILSSEATIVVESLLNDSIHIHDVHTSIKKTFGELKKEIVKLEQRKNI